MLQLKRNLLSASLASAIALTASGVQAQTAQGPSGQETATTELDKVVVVGIRSAIEKSIDAKQTSTSIVEAISAEDIGKLPDTSIADSLARLPGLTAQRFGNRPQEINIRGFAGDFSTATLNGREQVSLGNNRGVEFDQYPSELVNQVIVYKTPDASLVGQGLSGTVDLRTIRPLDYGERVTAVNLRGDRNKITGGSEVDGYRFSISHINQFADNTIGVAIGYAHLDNPGQGHEFGSWGYDGGVLQGGNVFDKKYDNVRDGLMGVIQFKPNENYQTTLDLFYSRFDKEEIKHGVQFATGGWAGGVVTRRVDNAAGNPVEVDYRLNFINLRNDLNTADDRLFAIGWNHELKLGDNWTLHADISNSNAKREEGLLEVYGRFNPGLETTLNARLNPAGYWDLAFGTDLTNLANFTSMDPGGWGGDRAQAGYYKTMETTDDLTSLRFDLARAIDGGPLSSIEFGANLTDRTKSRASVENTLCAQVNCASSNNVGVAIPPQYVDGGRYQFAGLVYPGINPQAMLDNVYVLLPKLHGDIARKNWTVNEQVLTGYVQANIDADIGPIPVRGNIGVQAVNVDQRSSGYEFIGGAALGEMIEAGTSYVDYLPSLNLSFEFPASQFLRFGAAKQVARPRMDDIRISNDTSYNPGTDGNLPASWRRPHFSQSGGNVELEPWRATTYDLSYEKYFADNKGYVSVAYFYKDLESYIYSADGTFDIRDTSFNWQDYTGVDPIGRWVRPTNGQGGWIKGHEISVSLPLEMLWAPLDGFGIQANYSDTDSNIQPFGPGSSEPLPGLSKYVSNATVYFERWGWAARVSQRHRSDFVGEFQGFGGDRERRFISAETVTDVSLSYTFGDGAMKGLSILAQVNNLENEPFRRHPGGFDDRVDEFQEYGRTYLLGLNYRF